MTAPSADQPSPGQEQDYPGRTAEMAPRPRDDMRDYEGRGLLTGSRALVTGGDSAATKGAVLALTYSLAQALQDRGIRVNSVAPGPVWTPLIPATMSEEKVSSPGGAARAPRPPR